MKSNKIFEKIVKQTVIGTGLCLLVFYVILVIEISSYTYTIPLINAVIYALASVSILPIVTLILILLPLRINKKIIIVCGICIGFYLTVELLLLIYHFDRNYPFDFFFLWYNVEDSMSTLRAINPYMNLILVFCIFCLAFFSIGISVIVYRLYGSVHRLKLRSVLLALIIFILVWFHLYVPNELIALIKRSRQQSSELAKMYFDYFTRSLDNTKRNRNVSAVSKVPDTNIFLLHLESINAELVNETTTPNFMKIARSHGILFPKLQGVSMQTIRAQEGILCSVLPSPGQSIAKLRSLTEDLICLPSILKKHGYRTFFFQNFPDLSFYNVEDFMRHIGFDELHSEDIMKKGDKQLAWGYVDDIFYTRVFEYLEKYKDKKIFVYIAVDSVNHFPFYGYEVRREFKHLTPHMPVKEPITVRDNMANSLFIQDTMISTFYKEYERNYGKDSLLFMFGDHSWPIGIHPNNTTNENGAFQENFVTSLAIIPPAKDTSVARGKTVERLYSQLDFAPTLLDSIGITNYHYSGKSFLPEFSDDYKGDAAKRCLISLQPYSDQYLSLVRYPKKYIFNIRRNTVSMYNLTKDPQEHAPVTKDLPVQTEHLTIVKTCLKEMTY